ncbi:MAG: hypothetical protein JWN43_4341, partial [Gammaproteobacteria bacterium]|nr:hypothetical protein [Gammaproteobacteria bacterium]
MKKSPAKRATSAKSSQRARTDNPTGAGTTMSGPSKPGEAATELAEHAADQQALAAAMPFNAAKPAEYGQKNAESPAEGPTTEMPSAVAGASTLSE